MEQAQLDFLSLIVPAPKPHVPLTAEQKFKIMAERLREERLSNGDILDYLKEKQGKKPK